MRKPNFYIIGAPKCGTSALASYLNDREDVFFCTPKEPFYWCSDLPGLRVETNATSLENYLALFSEANHVHKAIGEGSTTYLRSSTAILNILKFERRSKFIAMLRNPIDSVQATHMERLYGLQENVQDFEEAWRLQDARKSGNMIPRNCRDPSGLQYGPNTQYFSQIERLFKTVPRGQYKIILFDDFIADTRSVYSDVLDFLELSRDCRDEFPKINASRRHRFPLLAKLVLSPPKPIEPYILKFRRSLWSVKSGPIPALKARLRVAHTRKPISDQFRGELKEYYRPDVTKLSGLLGRDLSHWVE